MNRTITYPGAIPLDIDILLPQQNAMVALGGLMMAAFGSNAVVSGLSCTPASGLTVQIGPGVMTISTAVEQTSYGSLPANTGQSIVKMGINLAPIVTTTLTAPATAGQSINYLIEAQVQEQDGGAIVLPYYNAAAPTIAYSGPSNSGTAQNTRRQQTVAIQVKAGAAATTGTQATPGVDVGWTGLYVVTVASGAISLNTGNIALSIGSPFIPMPLGPGMVPGFSNAIAFSSSGTWTAPAGITKIRVTAVGGGGGGGAAQNTSPGQVSTGPGGNGAAWARGIVLVNVGQAYSFTIGTGGAGGNGGSGGNGGTTTAFGLLAPGGHGAPLAGLSSPPAIQAPANASGIGSGGYEFGSEQQGSTGQSGGSAGNGFGGTGGASLYGGGGNGGKSSNGGGGMCPGAGGGGGEGENGTGPYTGGRGADGVVVIEY